MGKSSNHKLKTSQPGAACPVAAIYGSLLAGSTGFALALRQKGLYNRRDYPETTGKVLAMAYMIKRYANRKLYDPQASQYVTLEELEEMIRAGREITVTDATTGEDLTAVILAQIILENARHRRPTLPAAFLHQLVQYGETWHDFALGSLKTSLEGLMTSQREADRILREWASRCGWIPQPQRDLNPDTSANVAREIAALKHEVAVLREQLQALAARLPKEPEP